MNVTVATWNVLADCYAHGHARATNATAKNEAPHVDKSANLPTSWNYRKSLIDKCLAECTADIICLQEVDHFPAFYEKCLEKHGYRPMYYQRPTRKDGCAIAFKPDKFELLAVDTVSCDDSIVADSLYEYQKYQKHNVGLSLRLRIRATDKEFVICTCHVHWNPTLPDVKVSQALYLLQRLKLFRDGDATPVIFTGDFNTLPEDVVYKGITHPDCITALTQKLRELRYGGALYGPKTRFLCDASLSKLCKWLRVLGVNVALDAWDNGVPASSQKNKNKSKWQWSCTPEATCKSAEEVSTTPAVFAAENDSSSTSPIEDARTAENGATPPPSLPPKAPTAKEAANSDPSYIARVNSINAFFARAEREKRVILTTSKSLRERASCPRNFYVNPQDLEGGLIDICAQFGLELSRDRFLTVCGKCGDEVEEVSREDPRLEHRYLPADRAVFACVNCAQPYWWNEKAGSLPAKAMEKAEELFSIVCAGQQQRSGSGKVSSSDTAVVAGAAADGGAGAGVGLAVVSSEDYALYSRETSEKARVKAGTCILKDFGRTAKNPTLKDLSCAQSFSKRAEWELEQERLRKMRIEAGEAGEASEGTADPSVTGRSEESPEPTTTSTTLASPSPASLTEEASDSGVTESTPDVVDGAPGAVAERTRITMEELSALFENRHRVLQEQKSAGATATAEAAGEENVTASVQGLSLAETASDDKNISGVLSLRSVFTEETLLTNWNGDFKGRFRHLFAHFASFTYCKLSVKEMNDAGIPLMDVVLVGGGHAHVHVIKMIGMNPISNVRFTLITKDVETPYSGMLPGYVAGYYTSEESHIDLGKLCSFGKFRLVHAEVTHIDTAEKKLHFKDTRPPMSYNILSINIGIVPRPLDPSCFVPSNQGDNNATIGDSEAGNITPVKPIDKFSLRWEAILNRVLQQKFTRRFTIAIVGGGAGGVELCFAVHHRLKTQLANQGVDPALLRVILLNRGEEIMSSHCSAVRAIISRLLAEKGIEVHNDTDVCSRTAEGALVAQDGRSFQADEVFWCTQAVGHAWLQKSGLQCDADGFILIKPTLESVNVRNVFAAGDICSNVQHPRPKAGVFAVRAGPPLYANICRAIRREPLEDWEPQSQFLGIIGTGDGYAVASKAGMGLEGAYLWTLKDKIDRDWMRGYQQLPTMEEMAAMALLKKAQAGSGAHSAHKGAAGTTAVAVAVTVTADGIPELARSMGQDTIDMLSKAKMRCGGCGSKVGAQVLTRALRQVKHLMLRRGEVITGLGDDAALVRPPAPPAYLVHSIDYFRSFINDPFIMGQIAVNHALSDVYAMNAEAVSALALCVLPYGPEHMMEEELVQMLAGALTMLSAANCSLVGGHTSEGAEAALGFSVTGVVHPAKALAKGPLPRGSALILTKALGTGTILAADMRAQAKGRWVSAAIASMLQPNRAAAAILQQHGATACTDVTGFGLLGHLIEMIQYEDAGITLDLHSGEANGADSDPPGPKDENAVELYLEKIPTLFGAKECILAGIVSSLQPQNVRCARAVANVEFGAGNPAYPLLFDPQTSGGLLATVPGEQAEAAVAALQAAGYPASVVIGRVLPRESGEFAPLVYLV